jgi:hypothetical protein
MGGCVPDCTAAYIPATPGRAPGSRAAGLGARMDRRPTPGTVRLSVRSRCAGHPFRRASPRVLLFMAATKKIRKKRPAHPGGVISAGLSRVLFRGAWRPLWAQARKVGDLAMIHPDFATCRPVSQRCRRDAWARRPGSPGRKKSSRPRRFSAPDALPRPLSATPWCAQRFVGTAEIISNLRADHRFQGSRSATQHSISFFQPQRAKGPREVVDLSPLQDDDSAPGLSNSTRRRGGFVEEGEKVAATVL